MAPLPLECAGGVRRELGEGGRARVVGGGVLINREGGITAAHQHDSAAHLPYGRGEARLRTEYRQRRRRRHQLGGGRGSSGSARVGGVEDLPSRRVGDLDADRRPGVSGRQRLCEHRRDTTLCRQRGTLRQRGGCPGRRKDRCGVDHRARGGDGHVQPRQPGREHVPHDQSGREREHVEQGKYCYSSGPRAPHERTFRVIRVATA